MFIRGGIQNYMFRPNPAIIRFSSERVNTDTLSDENLMMAGLGRNM